MKIFKDIYEKLVDSHLVPKLISGPYEQSQGLAELIEILDQLPYYNERVSECIEHPVMDKS